MIFGYSPSEVTFGRLLHLSTLAASARMIPQATSQAVCGIFLLSCAYLAVFRRTAYAGLLLMWFVVCYCMVTVSDAAFGWLRHALFYYPAIVLCIASALEYASEGKRAAARVVLVLLMVVTLINHSFFDDDSVFFTYRNRDSVFLPYDKAFGHFAKEMPGARVYAPAICEPSHFYLAKQRLDRTLKYGRKIWAPPDEQTLDGLADYMTREGYEYLLLPTSEREGGYGITFSSSPWLRQHVRWDLVKRIAAGTPRFVRVAAFRNRKARLELFRLVGTGGPPAPASRVSWP
jgi:hypothetical protein